MGHLTRTGVPGHDQEPLGDVQSRPRALTLYYRIRSSRSETAGRGLDAATQVILSAEVLAATLGPETKPSKSWIREVIGR